MAAPLIGLSGGPKCLQNGGKQGDVCADKPRGPFKHDLTHILLHQMAASVEDTMESI
jgi:hypothetical protein